MKSTKVFATLIAFALMFATPVVAKNNWFQGVIDKRDVEQAAKGTIGAVVNAKKAKDERARAKAALEEITKKWQMLRCEGKPLKGRVFYVLPRVDGNNFSAFHMSQNETRLAMDAVKQALTACGAEVPMTLAQEAEMRAAMGDRSGYYNQGERVELPPNAVLVAASQVQRLDAGSRANVGVAQRDTRQEEVGLQVHLEYVTKRDGVKPYMTSLDRQLGTGSSVVGRSLSQDVLRAHFMNMNVQNAPVAAVLDAVIDGLSRLELK